jgi:hypothetical protein
VRDYNGRCAQCGLWNCHHLYTTSNTANGPQTERSGVPNPEPDGLVTVELTREEAEWIVSITGYRNTAEGRKYKDPACGIDDKIRAALKGEA